MCCEVLHYYINFFSSVLDFVFTYRQMAAGEAILIDAVPEFECPLVIIFMYLLKN